MRPFFQYVLRYRRKVIRANLARCFPDMDLSQHKQLEKRIYRNFVDILLESFKGFTMSASESLQRWTIINPEMIDKYTGQHDKLIVVSSHCANWEWGAGALPHYKALDFKVLYKPIRNILIDAYVNRNRTKEGLELFAIQQTRTMFIQDVQKPTAYVLISDQSPSNMKEAIWVDFFGQQTACLHGVEKWSRHLNCPVLYMTVKRVKRGYYTVEIKRVTDTPMAHDYGEVTNMYMKILEDDIRSYPPDWIWSHRRWKRSPKA